MEAAPRFLQGVFPFTGGGLDKPAPLDGKLAYTVPPDKRAQLIYCVPATRVRSSSISC